MAGLSDARRRIVPMPVPASGHPNPNFDPSNGQPGTVFVDVPGAMANDVGQILGLGNYLAGGLPAYMAGMVNAAIPGQPFGDATAAPTSADAATQEAVQGSSLARAVAEAGSVPYLGGGLAAAGRGFAMGDLQRMSRSISDRAEQILHGDRISGLQAAEASRNYRRYDDQMRAADDIAAAARRPVPPNYYIGFDPTAVPGVPASVMPVMPSYLRSQDRARQRAERNMRKGARQNLTAQERYDQRVDQWMQDALGQSARNDVSSVIGFGDPAGDHFVRGLASRTNFPGHYNADDVAAAAGRLGYNMTPINNWELSGRGPTGAPLRLTPDQRAFWRAWNEEGIRRGYVRPTRQGRTGTMEEF